PLQGIQYHLGRSESGKNGRDTYSLSHRRKGRTVDRRNDRGRHDQERSMGEITITGLHESYNHVTLAMSMSMQQYKWYAKVVLRVSSAATGPWALGFSPLSFERLSPFSPRDGYFCWQKARVLR